MTKTCKVCELEKSLEEMTTKGKYKDGTRKTTNTCKKCSNKLREQARKVNKSTNRIASDKRRQDRFRMSNKDKLKDKSLVKAYGITLEEYRGTLNNQGGGCAVCTSTTSRGGRALAIDHDHNTGKIRGILCSDCNTALGLLKDSPELLAKATAYLLKQSVINLEVSIP